MSRQKLIAAAKAPTESFNEGDWEATLNSISPDFVYDEVPTGRTARGAEDVLELWKGWKTAFPDARASFEEPLVDGDMVVLRMNWTGTHTGPLQLPDGESPATNKSIEFRGCQLYHIRDGKAVSMAHYFDMLTMLSQLGLVSMKVPAVAP